MAEASVDEIVLKVAGEGIEIDGTVAATPVDADLPTKSYIDGKMADVVFENTSASGDVTITPLNGAKLVPLAAGTMLTEATLAEVVAIGVGTELEDGIKTLTDGTVAYTNGKSPKVAGATMVIKAADEFLVVSQSGTVTRVVIKEVSAMVDATTAQTVTATVYTAADNAGVTLYKTIK